MFYNKNIKEKNCAIYIFSDHCPSDWFDKNSEEKFFTFSTVTTVNLFELERFLKRIEIGLPRNRLVQYKDLRSKSKKDIYLDVLLNTINNEWDNSAGWINCYSYQQKSIEKIYESISEILHFGFGQSKDGYTHQGVNMNGLYQTIPISHKKLFTLYLWVYMIFDLYSFYKKKSIVDGGCTTLKCFVFSDYISGDNLLRREAEKTVNSIFEAFLKEGYFDNSFSKDDQIIIKSVSKDKQNLSMILVDNIARLLESILNYKINKIYSDDLKNLWKEKFGWNYLDTNGEIIEIFKTSLITE